MAMQPKAPTDSNAICHCSSMLQLLHCNGNVSQDRVVAALHMFDMSVGHLRRFSCETKERLAPVDLARQTRERRAYDYVAPWPQPAAEQLAGAEKRVCAPRTLTASILGDPAPGQSVLDTRNGEARV